MISTHQSSIMRPTVACLECLEPLATLKHVHSYTEEAVSTQVSAIITKSNRLCDNVR